MKQTLHINQLSQRKRGDVLHLYFIFKVSNLNSVKIQLKYPI